MSLRYNPRLFIGCAMPSLGVRILLLLLALTIVTMPTPANSATPEPPVCRGTDYRDRGETERRHLAEAEVQARSIRNGEGVLWRVRPAGGGEPSHILGTMHVTDPRVTTMGPALREAFERAEVVGFENRAMLDLGTGADSRARSLGSFIFTDGRRLTDLVEEPELTALRSALNKRRVPLWAISAFKPWMVVLGFLQVTPCEVGRFVAGKRIFDAELHDRAKRAGKKTTDLEDLEVQAARLDGLSLADQLSLLRAVVAEDEDLPDRVETAIRLYAERRIAMIMPLMTRPGSGAVIPEDVLQRVMTTLLDHRNGDMFEHAVPLVDRGGALIAVGAAHLVGDTGLVARFQDAGYIVTRIE